MTLEQIHKLAFELLNESIDIIDESDPEVIRLRVDKPAWDNLWREYFNREG